MDVLIIMDTFAPYNSCGSIPNTKLVKYLAREDLHLTLLTIDVAPGMPVDYSLLPKEMDRITTYRMRHSWLYIKTVNALRQKAKKSGTTLKMKAEKRPLRARAVSKIMDLYYSFQNKDLYRDGVRKIRKHLMNKRFDIVYSSYPSSTSHALAQYVMEHHIAKKWVADFRDPMAYMEFYSDEYEEALASQHQLERAADHVVVVSEGAMDKFRFDDIPESKLSYLPNGYDPEDCNTELRESHSSDPALRFFYAGSLYAGKRDLTVLFRALADLSKEGKIDLKTVKVEYAGNEYPILLEYAGKYHLEKICVDYGYVPRHRVMEIMSDIDVTLVSTHNTQADKGVVTGKVFELLMVGKPILAVITGDLPDSELGSIVRSCKAGFVYEDVWGDRDYSELKHWLLSLYEEKLSTGYVSSSIDSAAREAYSYSKIAKKLYGIFKQLTNNGS